MKVVSNDYVDIILRSLKKKDGFDQTDLQKMNKYLNEIKMNRQYESGSKISYAHLSSKIRDMQEQERDTVYKNAEQCIYSEVEEENEVLIQIINHIMLEVPRANDLDSVHKQNEYSTNKINEFNSQQDDFIIKMSKFEDRFSEVQSEFIGILSIFSAVIIGFFGGLSIIGSALSNMSEVSIYRITCITIILGIIMFNVIYMLLKEVGKLAGKDNCTVPENMSLKESILYNINRHPYVYFYNIISLLGLLIEGIIYGINYYNVEYITKNWMIFIIFFLLGILILGFAAIIPKLMNLSNKNNKSGNVKKQNA